jgi:hypothetical protein
MCGSKDVREHKATGNNTINKGLPERFARNEWFYFVCNSCSKRAEQAESAKKGIHLCFTIAFGKVYIFDGKTQSWFEENREVVQFT